MANRFFGINRGQHQTDVTNASTTQSKDIEVNLDLSKSITKAELLIALEEISNYIIATSTYPAS